MRYVVLLCRASMVVALVWVLYRWVEPLAIFASPEVITFAPADPGEEYSTSLIICNWSLRAVTIVGGEERCGPAGCNYIRGTPLRIPPMSSAEMRVDFRCGGPGKHVLEFPLYLDHPAVPVLRLRVLSVINPEKSHQISRVTVRGED